ncbi:MAG: hypothetical protein RIR52_369 [Acidobacteriota bacterium]|jgi:hypothetical protein
MQECKNFCPHQIDRSIGRFTSRPRHTLISTRPRITPACRIDFVTGIWNRHLGRFVKCTTNPVSNYFS